MGDSISFESLIALFGIIQSPIYAIMIWRMKVSITMKTKLDKLCTAFQIEFPQHKGLFKGT